MTHDELVARAVRWLDGTGGCSIVFSEFATTALETPDAIGFKSRRSIVIECKTSRADFYAENRKTVRRIPHLAMGSERYYMVPAGLISVKSLPPKWGLLYVFDRHVRVVRKSEGFVDRNYMSEIGFLASMLRRIKIRMRGDGPYNFDLLNQWIKDKTRDSQGKLPV